MSITPKQARAARAWLMQDQKDVHFTTGISVNQISTFELGKAGMSARNLGKLKDYFEAHGLELINGGVREKPEEIVRHLKGRDGFRIFMNEVYDFAAKTGGRIRIMNGAPQLFIKWLGEEWYAVHAERMREVKSNIDFRIIIEEGDKNLIAGHFAQYRWLPKGLISEDTLYFFGRTVAFFTFSEDELHIAVCHLPKSSEQIQWMFDFVWDQAKEAS